MPWGMQTVDKQNQTLLKTDTPGGRRGGLNLQRMAYCALPLLPPFWQVFSSNKMVLSSLQFITFSQVTLACQTSTSYYLSKHSPLKNPFPFDVAMCSHDHHPMSPGVSLVGWVSHLVSKHDAHTKQSPLQCRYFSTTCR